MTEPTREQLRLSIANAQVECSEGGDYRTGQPHVANDEFVRDEILFTLGLSDLSDKQLAVIKEKLEQTREKCPECKGTGDITHLERYGDGELDFDRVEDMCLVCDGSGRGKVRPEMLAVLDEGRTLPTHFLFVGHGLQETYSLAQQDMLQAGFKKVKAVK